MKYHRMIEHDVDTVFHAGKDNFGQQSEYSWDWSVPKIQEFLDEAYGFGVVATEAGTFTGFALVVNNYSSQRPHVAWLNYIYICPEFRKKQNGIALLEHVVQEVKQRGKTELIADVYAHNKQALIFFDSHDFKIAEQWYILTRKL